MEDESRRLIEQAAKCRRIASSINDPEWVQRLNALADEYEAKAAGRTDERTSRSHHPPISASAGNFLNEPAVDLLDRSDDEFPAFSASPKGTYNGLIACLEGPHNRLTYLPE
jgi:hypothetical protein